MRRILLLVLASLTLGACGGSSPTVDESSIVTSADESTTEEPVPAEGLEYVRWRLDSRTAVELTGPDYEVALDPFRMDDGSHTARLEARWVSGDLPDEMKT